MGFTRFEFLGILKSLVSLLGVSLAAAGLALWAFVSTGPGPMERLAGGHPYFVIEASAETFGSGVPPEILNLKSPVIFYSHGDPTQLAGHHDDARTVYRRTGEGNPSLEQYRKVFDQSRVVDLTRSPVSQVFDPRVLVAVPLEKIPLGEGLYIFPNLSADKVALLKERLALDGRVLASPGEDRIAGFFHPVIFAMFLVALACVVVSALRLGKLTSQSGNNARTVRAVLGHKPPVRLRAWAAGLGFSLVALFLGMCGYATLGSFPLASLPNEVSAPGWMWAVLTVLLGPPVLTWRNIRENRSLAEGRFH